MLTSSHPQRPSPHVHLSQQTIQRLLVPLKSLENPIRAISYVIRRRAEGRRVLVYLLHIEDAGSALKTDHTETQATQSTHLYARVFGPAVHMLEGLDIGYATLIRPGPVVFSILDAAEELECEEIVVPAPGSGLRRLLSSSIVKDLLAQQRSVRISLATEHGFVQPR